MAESSKSDRLCQNCAEPVEKSFCSNCGQEYATAIVPIDHLLRDVQDQVLLLDSKLGRTLHSLFLKPGFLTNEYIGGRRIRYLSPFRLYFVISAIYFLAFSLAHYDVTVMHGLAYTLEQAHPEHISAEMPESHMSSTHMGHDAHTNPGPLRAVNAKSLERAHRHHQAVERTADWFVKNQNLITFMLVPVAAMLLKLLYRKSKRLYIEHLVFAVHVQSLMFALLLPALLPYGRSFTYLLALSASAVYLYLAMRAVYRETASLTLAKCGAMLGGYLILMTCAALAAFAAYYNS